MKPMIVWAVLVLAGCKKEKAREWHTELPKYTEPVPGQPPTEDMVRVPASPDGAVREFFIDKNEVTVGEYEHCVDMKRCDARVYIEPCTSGAEVRWHAPNHPVNCIYPQVAKQYCAYRGKRLPTRDEWLRAARGDDGRAFPWGVAPPTCKTAVIHDSQCPSEHAEDVGSRPDGASPYGVMDMVGNVSELVYVPPQLHREGAYAMMGGNFSTLPETLAREGLQQEDPISWQAPSFGFRCAWSPEVLKPSADK